MDPIILLVITMKFVKMWQAFITITVKNGLKVTAVADLLKLEHSDSDLSKYLTVISKS